MLGLCPGLLSSKLCSTAAALYAAQAIGMKWVSMHVDPRDYYYLCQGALDYAVAPGPAAAVRLCNAAVAWLLGCNNSLYATI